MISRRWFDRAVSLGTTARCRFDRLTSFGLTALLLGALLLSSCAKDPDPTPSDPLPPDVALNTVVIGGISYTLYPDRASYYSGFYPFVGMDCTTFYIQCANAAGITVEIDERLVGRTIYLERGEIFWFIAVGNGTGFFAPLQHDTVGAQTSGWFRVERDLTTDHCTLYIDLTYVTSSGQQWPIAGNFSAVFRRLSSI